MQKRNRNRRRRGFLTDVDYNVIKRKTARKLKSAQEEEEVS